MSDTGKTFKIEAAEITLKNLCARLINKKFEALWLERFIDKFKLTHKPFGPNGQPNQATIYTTDNKGIKIPKSAETHLKDIKNDVEELELQEGAINSLISELKRE